ncbi:MAG: putative Ig domain-containing protein [Bdellovibrionales bacterium]|nr:putative Ig domain-containing protein [Bdellovibrionales bacterium]
MKPTPLPKATLLSAALAWGALACWGCGSGITDFHAAKLKAVSYPNDYLVVLIGSESRIEPTVLKEGSVGDLSFALSPSTLPSGLSFDASSGAISGTATLLTPEQDYVLSLKGGSTTVSFPFTLRADVGYAVDTLADEGDSTVNDGFCLTASSRCSLRAALEESDANAAARVILVPNGEYLLGASPITLGTPASEIEVIGESEKGVVVNRAALNRHFILSGGSSWRLFRLTLIGGFGLSSGGSISLLSNNSTLTIEECTLAGNLASPAADGGAIFASANNLAVNVIRSTFSENSATNSGGAISFTSNGGTLNITDSWIRGNSTSAAGGGAVLVSNGALAVDRTTFSSNSAGAPGGALYLGSTDTCLVTNSTFSDNVTTGGNAGAAIHLAAAGILSVSNSTFYRNLSGSGGALSLSAGALSMRNSVLVAQGDDFTVTGGTLSSLGGNISDLSDAAFVPVDDALSATGIGLSASLKANGGFAPTHLISKSGLAYRYVNTAACPAVDQRQKPRPATQCSAGALEP